MIWLAILLLTSFVPHKRFGTLQIKKLLFFLSVVKSFYFHMKFSRLIEITNLLNNISAYALLLICHLGMYIVLKTFPNWYKVWSLFNGIGRLQHLITIIIVILIIYWSTDHEGFLPFIACSLIKAASHEWYRHVIPHYIFLLKYSTYNTKVYSLSSPTFLKTKQKNTSLLKCSICFTWKRDFVHFVIFTNLWWSLF